MSKKKRLLYQATHRGTREADLCLGGFVQYFFHDFSSSEWSELESFLDLPDATLLSILSGIHPSFLEEKMPFAEKIRTYIKLPQKYS